jgi:site-specific recombinase XerD
MHTEIVTVQPVAALATQIVGRDHSGARSDRELVALWLARKSSERTRRAYAADAAGLFAFLDAECVALQAATARDLQAWAASLTGAPRSCARRISAIKSLFRFGHRLGYLTFNVAGVIESPKVANDLAERILTVDDVRALLAVVVGRERVLLSFLYFTGARISEACAVQWRHVHALPDGRATVTLHGKGGKTRHVLMPAAIVAELEQLRGDAAEGVTVFRTRSGLPLHPANVRHALVATAARAGLARVSPHWLRHAHASHALDNGAPIHVVQATLGHASVATTGRYLHAKPTDSGGMYLAL